MTVAPKDSVSQAFTTLAEAKREIRRLNKLLEMMTTKPKKRGRPRTKPERAVVHPRETKYYVVTRDIHNNGVETHMLTKEEAEAQDIVLPKGPPRVLAPDPLTLEKVFDLSRLNCTEAEFAAAFRVPMSTWMKFKSEFPEVQETIDEGRGDGKVSLRRLQRRLAEEGSTPMAIHLGKHELGQQEKAVVQHEHTIFQKLMELPDDSIEGVATIVDNRGEDDDV